MSLLSHDQAEGSNSNPLGLDEAELKCLSTQVELPPSQAGYFAIYGYANALDKFMMAASLFCSVAAGAAVPLLSVRHKQARCW